MSTILHTTLKTLLILLIPILLVLGSILLLTNESYLAYEYGKANFPADRYGFSPQLRFILASTNIHYVRAHLPENELFRQTLNGISVYSAPEITHMMDVRAVFQTVIQFWQSVFVLFVILGYLLWKHNLLTTFWSGIEWGGILAAGLMLTIALLAFFAWQTSFELFHRLLFLPGSWLFSYKDTLIRLFPMQFWVDATLIISILSFAGGLLLALIGWRGQEAVARRAACPLQPA